MENLEALKDLEMRFVDKNGAVYAAWFKDGVLVYLSDKYLTGSLDSMDFTRDTKRVIKVWDVEGNLLETIAPGTLAPYWDAAQAAKEKPACGMTVLDALKGCAAALGKIKAPVDLLEEVSIPVLAAKNTIRDVIRALEERQEEQK